MSGTISSIPASSLVNVIPGVLTAGGTGTQTNGLFLDSGTRVPTGTVYSFASAAAVLAWFGTGTVYTAAQTYFGGFTNGTAFPAAMLVAQYPTAAEAGYLKGGVVSGLTLAQLQAISGTLTITFAGSGLTAASINLSSVTSFSNAASTIQSAFTSPPFTVTYDSTWGSFVFTSTATGAAETITYATGTAAASLCLTLATGAVLSPGVAAVVSPSAYMTALLALNTNWATFTTLFNPDNSGNANKLAFATWNGGQNNRFAYVPWDTDITATQSAQTGNLGYLIKAANISGTCLFYDPTTFTGAVFAMGLAASLNFGATNGRQTLAYRNASGLPAVVTTQTVATNLLSYGYNFVGSYATAAANFTFVQNGSISGIFLWFDSYINQIWMNSGLQAALLNLLMQVGNIPYNNDGYTLIAEACQAPINAALNFGAIRTGVALSPIQIAELNNAAGFAIASTVQAKGYYLLIQPASATVRAARGTPPITLFYVDGQSVQAISLASIEVQ